MTSPKVLSFFFIVVMCLSNLAISKVIYITREEAAVTYHQAEHLTYEWTITNVTLLPHKNRHGIQSPFFHHVGLGKDDHWLSFFPRGSTEEAADYASLFLHTWTPIDGNEISGMNGELSIWKSEKLIAKETFANISVNLHGYGYPFMVKRSELLDPSYADDDILIHCEIDMPWKSITEVVKDV